MSTLERVASATSGQDRATVRSFVTVDSDLEFGSDSLSMVIDATVLTTAELVGASRLSSSVFFNANCSFSFINHVLDFELTSDYDFSFTGLSANVSVFPSRSRGARIQDAMGALGPGSYQFRLTQSHEFRAGLPVGTHRSGTSHNLNLALNAATAGVPEPSVATLLGIGLLGLAAAGYRNRQSNNAMG